jgi:hypothetical protein
MKNDLDENSENHPNRVRRNTRPYVGVIDWFDNVNTDPFSEPVQYYGSIEIDGYFRPGILSSTLSVYVMNCSSISGCPRF